MVTRDDVENYRRLVRGIDPDSRLLRAWELQGGLSARVVALEIARPDGVAYRCVARHYGVNDLRQHPRVAASEYRLLKHLRAGGLPVPDALYADESGVLFPTPYLVIEYVEGEPEFAPTDVDTMVAALAACLAALHTTAATADDLPLLPDYDSRVAARLASRPAALDESLSEGLIRGTLEAGWPFPRRNPQRVLHGDFWPGNALWNKGRLMAVIDWEDAAFGDPLADLGNARLEMFWAFGSAAMQHFTEAYRQRVTLRFDALPWWDLYAALRPAGVLHTWGIDRVSENRMRERHAAFVAQAVAQLRNG